MKRNDIRAIYSAKVAELLAQGYTIYPDSMRGSQGEIAKIDLSRGSEIIRVLLEHQPCISREENGFSWWDGAVIMTVGRAQQDGNWFRGEWDDTLWNQRMDIIERHTWYEIGGTTRAGRADWYLEEAEARKASEIRIIRYRRNVEDQTECGDAHKAIAIRWLKKQPIRGMKSKKASDIKSMRKLRRKNGGIYYQIRMNGNYNTYDIG